MFSQISGRRNPGYTLSPNHCIYCTYPCLEGGTVRTRCPEVVAGEIAMLHKDFK
ncbi:MAG: hypothetical protein ABSA71_16630 [Desulfomonilia bacterium]